MTKGSEQKKSALCAKLAQKAVDLYTSARVQLETPTLSAIVNKAWNEHITYQVHVFTAMSQYKQSEVDHEIAEENAEGYGLELGRLAHAEREWFLHLSVLSVVSVVSVVSVGTVHKDLAQLTDFFFLCFSPHSQASVPWR